MIKQTILAGVAGLSIAVATAPALAADAAVPVATAATAKPELGTWGFDTSGMDKSVSPGDSFFGFANGHWAKTTEIPADRSNWGGFAILRDLSDKRTRAIIEEAAAAQAAPGSNQQKVGDYFATFMDEAAIEAKGAQPLQPHLQRIAAIGSKAELARTFGELGHYGVAAPVGAQVEQDLKDNSRYTVYLGQGGLGLPDRDYYLDDSNPKCVEARAK